MDEKNLLDRIRKSADSLETPDSLHPDQIKKKLELAEPKKKPLSSFRKAAAAAAVLVLGFVSLWQTDRMGILSPDDPTQNLTEASKNGTGGKEETEAAAAQAEMETEAQPEDSSSLSDYENLYLTLKEHFVDTADAGAILEGESIDGATAVEDSTSSSAGESAVDESAEAVGDFSQTNIQEMGVDEADTVRTDGTYLYILSPSGRLRIVEASGGEMELICSLELPNPEETAEEMYLDGDTLSLITSGSSSSLTESASMEDAYYVDSKSYICLYTYDISDRSAPMLTGSVQQEGIYRTSRKQGDYVYLFSEYTPNLGATPEESTFIPKAGGSFIPLEDILIPEDLNSSSYLVVSSVDARAPEQIHDRKAIVSAASLFYVSTENIYICNSHWDGAKEYTQLMKFHYENGSISADGAGRVPGSVNDSFSLSEHQGNLRILTTDYSQSACVNHLFILDSDLKVIGKLNDLAPDETIRSARYLGDIAYFVTFRDTDPLFSVDVSDPENPVLLGDLKVTGFSSYLHFYGEDLLLGLGNEVDPDTGEYLGIKLSMFDISDPANVTEVHKYIIQDAYDCPGLYNYKAILADPGKNILGFACEDAYLVFTYDPEKGFVSLLTQEIQNASSQSARGLYISDTFYLIDSSSVKAYQMSADYQQIGALDL